MTDFAEDYSSPSSALDDEMFMFSSQPPAADQLAMFSSDSSADEEEDLDFGVYDQKPYLSKFSCAHQHRQQRHLATVPVPSMEAQPIKKQHLLVPFMGSLSELCEQKPNLVADVPRCSHQTLSVQPSAVSPSSRIKSTTPNIKLLFSLFDVLEDDSSDDDSCSSSISSSPSSPASFSDRHSTPEAVASPSRVPDVDAPKFAVVPNVLYRTGSDSSSLQWTTPVATASATVVVGDRATMLSSFADLE